MVKITGVEEHRKRLQRMRSPEAQKKIYQGLLVAGGLIETDAEISITRGSISGKGHVVSAPGAAPNADTRQLDTSIDTTGDPEAVKVFVTSRAPYSAALEFGTSKMAARPFMRPAARRQKKAAQEIIRKVVNRINRKKK